VTPFTADDLSGVKRAILQDAGVAEALIQPSRDGDGLDAFVVPSPGASDEAAAAVAEWRTIYNWTYKQTPAAADPLMNVSGWNSSYTGRPIPQDEMNEWVDATVGQIEALRPRRILEIGCGTGMLLLRLAQGREHYVGTDISAVGLAHIRGALTTSGLDPAKVELLEAGAHDFSGISQGQFDVVVINSVVQYFPNLEYLLRVLEGAAQALRPGGIIYLGDLRNLALTDAFATSVSLFKAEAVLGLGQLKERIRRRRELDRELAIDPRLFFHLGGRVPSLRRVRAMLRRGRGANEMSCYRYDVLLEKVEGPPGAEDLAIGAADALDWPKAGLEPAELDQRLSRGLGRPLVIRDLPNARLWDDVHNARALAEADGSETVADFLRARAAATPAGLVDPGALWDCFKAHGEVHLEWARSGDPAAFDAWFFPHGTDHSVEDALIEWIPMDGGPLDRFASDPGRTKRESRLADRLQTSLKGSLVPRLVPSRIVILDRLPQDHGGDGMEGTAIS
jgi:SAM-dependent methyltransferase